MRHETAVVLHNIRSSHNVGSIFRTSDGAGVAEVFLIGYTPTPSDRFGKISKEIAKTALGAEKHIAWKHFSSFDTCFKDLRKKGYTIVAIEQSAYAVSFRRFKKKGKVAFVFGNEVRGLSPALLKKADEIIEIPMHGKKESLNVSVAAGIVLFNARN